MKKILAAILLSSSLSYGQSFEVSAFGGGGISTAWGSRFPLDGTNSIFGSSAGLNFAYNIDGINMVRLEAQYDNKSFIWNGVTDQNHYITISPMAQFFVSQKIKFYFLIGQYTGILANKTSNRKGFDVGIILGIGYRQFLFKDKFFIFIEAKEYFGLINTYNPEYVNTNKFNGVLGLGYNF